MQDDIKKPMSDAQILNEVRRVNEMISVVYEKAAPTGAIVKDGIIEFTYNKTVTGIVDTLTAHRELLLKRYQDS